MVPPIVATDSSLFDVRLLQYEAVNSSGVTRTLKPGYTPAGMGDSYFPGGCNGTCGGIPDGMFSATNPNSHPPNAPCRVPGFVHGDTTNLKPGQYWFAIQAVAADSANNSALSAVRGPLTISMGPDEARELIEGRLGDLGATATSLLRLIDLRGPTEFGEEGTVRYFGDEPGNRRVWADFDTQEKAEAIFGHVGNKKAVTIMVL